jgi:hypothetical protein
MMPSTETAATHKQLQRNPAPFYTNSIIGGFGRDFRPRLGNLSRTIIIQLIIARCRRERTGTLHMWKMIAILEHMLLVIIKEAIIYN